MSSLQLVSQEDIPMKNCIEIKLSSVKKYLSIPNINGAVVEVSEWIRNFSQHFIMDVIPYPFCD